MSGTKDSHCKYRWWWINLRLLAVILLSCTQWSLTRGQESKPDMLRIVSYNVENLFDTTDNPDTQDNEFLPTSHKGWTEGRYKAKVKRLGSVLSEIGGWDFPDIIGLVEVENETVVKALAESSSLRPARYDYLVSEGTDPRGINAALMWRRDHLQLVEAHEIPHYGSTMFYPHEEDARHRNKGKEQLGRDQGRNTLWVTLKETSTGEQIDLFVVHAPSRRGGDRATERKRIRVMEKLKQVVTRLISHNSNAKIIILGDFNDNPDNRSLRKGLGAIPLEQAKGKYRKDRLYNLASPLYRSGKGTHHYKEGYWMPDQIIVSGALLSPREPMRIQEKHGLQIYDPKKLQRKGRPYRTYQGGHHTGGYSDHFPIFVDIILSDKE
ncbi:MAG: hypothetical protein Q4D93_05895 [Porphyromonas sp.]|nr:hypothetical protein [Porphyromonas sp.]